MAVASHLRILWHLLAARVRGNTHKQRLESFYAGQAKGYDDFRRKLLHGRRKLMESLPVPDGGVWVDIGAGTGANAEFLGERIHRLHRVYQVDLCRPLLQLARERAARHGWKHVLPIEADATRFRAEEPVDLVTFSYSLTMIPDWFAAIERACEMLTPGGILGVVDFYVSRKFSEQNRLQHGWVTRTFWPTWFAFDNVFLSSEHLPLLESRLETVQRDEHFGSLPFLPLIKAPYYVFLGRKR